MNTRDTTEPTLRQYQNYNGGWSDFIDEQHYLETVAEGKCLVRALYAAPQPVTAPACRMLTIEESGAAASSQDWDYDEVTTQIKKFCEVNNLNLKLPATEQPVIAPELTALQAIACQLRKAGATIPAENRGTIESAIKTGLSIALLLVEDALAKNGGAA